jgi:cell division protein FtsQ
MRMANARGAYRAEAVQARVQARRKNIRRLLGVAALLAFFAVMAIAVNRLIDPQTLPIKRVLIEGDLHHLARADLMNSIQAHAHSGFFRVDLDKLEQSVRKLPWVAAVSARRAWPDALLVRVREQVPIARWGSEALLNSRGEIFQPSGGDLPDGLPLLFGPKGRERYLIGQFHAASQLLKGDGVGLKALVEDERRAWYMVLDNGIPVALGRNRPEDKVRRFARIYPRTLAEKVDKVAGVDMRYPNGFAVAWKPGSAGGGGAK